MAAIALGGSWARGEARPGSDVDLGIYYRDERRPSLEALHRLAGELGYRDPGEEISDFGGWGPWINGGAWLRVEGREVDWILRDLGRVERIIEECRAGRPALHHQPGHPHGFHTHIYLAEVHHCRPLLDPHGELQRLKSLTQPYPPLLKRALVRDYLWQADFALDTSRKTAERGDILHTAGSFFQCAASLVQVLFALNERYFLNEKGSLAATDSFELRPDGFGSTIAAVLGHPGESPGELLESHGLLSYAVEETRALCGGLLKGKS